MSQRITTEIQAVAINPFATSTVYAGAEFYSGDFLVKINGEGSRLLYSSYFGGNSVAADASGNVYIGGVDYYSQDHPVKNAFQSTARGGPAFLAKIKGIGGSSSVKISGASVSGKKLIVIGENFSEGAVIMLDHNEQATSNDPESPLTSLISKKAGKKMKIGQEVMIQVRNSDGALSEPFPFVRQE